jgi:hypothetical protein
VGESPKKKELTMFEIFTKKMTRTTEPSVTLMMSGRIGLNKNASGRLLEKGFERVLLLWDKDARQVGIRPLSKMNDPRSYKLNESTRCKSLSLSTLTFFQHINYKLDKTRSFPVGWNEDQGMYVFTIPAEYLNGNARVHRHANKPASKISAPKAPAKESQVASHLTQ